MFDELIAFVKKHSQTTDIFCLQEVFDTESGNTQSGVARANLYKEIEQSLPNHNGYFAVSQEGHDFAGYAAFDIKYGQVMFVHKDIDLEEEGHVFTHRHKNGMETFDDAHNLGRPLQYITFNKDNKQFMVANMHGLWNGKGKSDDEDRINQSKNIKKVLDGFDGSKVLCGDFNLLPHTESIKILEKDMKNLITDFNIKSTRSSIYTKELKHADYVLTTPDVKVKHFEVLQDEVSDHLPLLLEFD